MELHQHIPVAVTTPCEPSGTALAIVVLNYAELTRFGRVTRARMTQIMNLLNLVPDTQEAILFLPRLVRGRATVTERELRAIVREMDWGRQREV